MSAAPVDRAWLAGLPKAENHVHLEGSIDPAVLGRASHREHRDAAPGPATNLDELLEMNDLNCSLLTEVGDLVEAAAAQAATETAQGVGYTDLIVNPSHWGAWGHRPREMLEALDEGFSRAEAGGPVRTGLSLSIGRHSPWRQPRPWWPPWSPPGSTGWSGSASTATSRRPAPAATASRQAVAAAREAGLHIAVHTGESGGVDHIWRNLEVLSPDRIDHGVRPRGDPTCGGLARRGTTLAMCPTSNVVLGVVVALGEHPIDRLRRAGVPVTVNTDDPMVFGTDLLREYEIAYRPVRVGPASWSPTSPAPASAPAPPARRCRRSSSTASTATSVPTRRADRRPILGAAVAVPAVEGEQWPRTPSGPSAVSAPPCAAWW